MVLAAKFGYMPVNRKFLPGERMQSNARKADTPDDTSLAARRLKLWIRMLGVTRAVENELREFLRVSHDTTLPRFDVMAALYRNRTGLTMTELSRMLLVSNGNATTVVNRLVNDGVVDRIPSEEDRRRITVTLTPEGVAQFETLAAEHRAVVDRLFSTLDEQDLNAMRDILRRIRAGLPV